MSDSSKKRSPGRERADQDSIFSRRLRDFARSTGAHVGTVGDAESKANADSTASYFRSGLPTPHSITGLDHFFESQGIRPPTMDESAIDIPDMTLDRPPAPRVAETFDPSDFADTSLEGEDEDQEYGDTIVEAIQSDVPTPSPDTASGPIMCGMTSRSSAAPDMTVAEALAGGRRAPDAGAATPQVPQAGIVRRRRTPAGGVAGAD